MQFSGSCSTISVKVRFGWHSWSGHAWNMSHVCSCALLMVCEKGLSKYYKCVYVDTPFFFPSNQFLTFFCLVFPFSFAFPLFSTISCIAPSPVSVTVVVMDLQVQQRKIAILQHARGAVLQALTGFPDVLCSMFLKRLKASKQTELS